MKLFSLDERLSKCASLVPDGARLVDVGTDHAYLPVWLLKNGAISYAVASDINEKPLKSGMETAEKYGEEQVKIWRRSFDVKPPELDPDDDRNPAKQDMFRGVDAKDLPLTESLETTIERVVPYFEETIKKDMLAGKRVIIAAHGNSLRALVKYFDNMTPDEILGVNIPTGVPLVYEFDDNFNVIKSYYLGDQEALKAKMEAVANQGKAK
jgi:2,3-bisphosphoglycerate-dependent phosphoglycerate mutase